jgi:hypothetical protein
MRSATSFGFAGCPIGMPPIEVTRNIATRRAGCREDRGAASRSALSERLACPLGAARDERFAAAQLESLAHQRISSDAILSPSIPKM